MAYDNTNSGVLFKNDRKEKESQPDFTGKINVGGTEYQLAAWVKEGQKGKFYSLRVSEKNQQTTQKPQQTQQPDFDDSIPF
jgi:hypothetical protein